MDDDLFFFEKDTATTEKIGLVPPEPAIGRRIAGWDKQPAWLPTHHVFHHHVVREDQQKPNQRASGAEWISRHTQLLCKHPVRHPKAVASNKSTNSSTR